MTKIRTKAPQTQPLTSNVQAKTALPKSRSFNDTETTTSETPTEGQSHFFSPPDPPNIQPQSSSPTGYSLNGVSILDYTPASLQMKRLVTSPTTEGEEDSSIFAESESEQGEAAPPETPPPEDNQPNLQRQAKADGSFVASSNIADRIIQRKGRGVPLPNSTRDFMESRFENDFSQVRLHTDSEAVQLSHDLKAKAFTHENDIYFNAGQYNPNSSSGKQLLAHELTHTIQQTGAKVQRKTLRDRASKINRIQRKSSPQIQRSSDEENVSINLKPLSSPSPEHTLFPQQSQLTVGASGSQDEQEADRIARQVMSIPPDLEPIQRAGKPRSRRPSKIPYSLLHNSEESEDEKNVNITLKAEGNGAFQASPNIENRLNSSKGGGSSLPKPTQNFMESRFGNDFGNVRVHTGSEAVQMNRDLNAKAFTHGEDIYFNSSQYNPDSNSGKELLAHELTHTIQQTGPKVYPSTSLRARKKSENRAIKINKIQRSPAVIQRDKKEDIENDKKKAEEKIEQEITEKKKEGGDFSAADQAKSKAKQQAEKTKELANAESEDVAKQRGEALEKESDQLSETEQTEAENTEKKGEDIIKTEQQKDQAEAQKEKEIAETQATEQGTTEGEDNPEKAETLTEDTIPDEGLLEGQGEIEGLENAGQAETAPNLEGQPAPQSPDADPAFQAAVNQTEQLAAEQSSHKPAEDKAKEAQEAAVDPNQQMRQAQASQAEEASQKEVKAFDREAFVSGLLAVLDQNQPKSQQDVEQGKGASNATEGIKQEIEKSKADSGGELEQSATRPPAPELETPKISTPTPNPTDEAGTPPPPDAIDAAATVPKSQSEADVEQPLAETKQALDVLIPEKIQTKLTVGAPGDKYEQEADRMAEAVMQMSDADPVVSETGEAPQRMSEDAENQTIERSPQPTIQRREGQGFTAETPTQEGEVLLDENRVELYQSEAGINVTGAVEEAKTQVETSGKQFREQEQGVQTETLDVQAGAVVQTQEQMFATRSEEFINVANTQAQTQQQDETERAKVTQEIQAIYDETQTNVNGILNRMDARVNAEFEATNKRARAAFEARQRELFEAWKQKYYYEENPLWIPWIRIEAGWAYVRVKFYLKRFFNSPLWAINKIFTGLPDEVNQIYVQAREAFIEEQKAGVYRIADIVEAELTEAQNAVQEGRNRVNTYVDSLPENLQSIGAEAAANVQSQFDSLESSINDRQNQLVDDLTAKYEASLKEIDDRIQELKDQNKSFISKAIEAIADLAKWILRQILKLVEPVIAQIPGIGSKAGEFLDAFIDDPIGIMSTLFGGIGQGFENFGKNIAQNLQMALFDWLLGMDMPIKFPDKFDLQGVLDIILQVLGLTKDYIFDMASSLMPDWAGEMLEAVLEGGPSALDEYVESSSEDLPQIAIKFFEAIAKFPDEGIMALWDLIKAGLSGLKDILMSEIMYQVVIPQIVIAGIQWVLSLTNPASGVLKIAKAIVDLLIFLISNMDMILAVLQALGAVMSAVINKSISQVANAVEYALVTIIPLVLGLFASILGLGGIPQKIQKVMGALKSPIDDVLGGVFDTVGSALMIFDPSSMFIGGGDGNRKGKKSSKSKSKTESKTSNKTQKPKTDSQKDKTKTKDKDQKKKEKKEKKQQKKNLNKVKSKLKKKIKKDPEISDVKATFPEYKKKYDLDSLKVTKSQEKEDSSSYTIVGVASQSSSSSKKKGKVQRKAVSASMPASGVTPDIERSLARQQGRGESLSSSVREPMETAFGVNFGQVRIHRDSESNRLSRSLDAEAFTTGTDIFFGQNNYNPSSSQGQKLLAHELTHVVQQSGEQPNIHRFFDSDTYSREAIPSIQTRQTQTPTIQLAPSKTSKKNQLSDQAEDVEQEVKIRSKIKKQTLTMNVTVRDQEEDRDWDFLRPPEEDVSDIPPEQQLSPSLISNVVKAIQAIVNNNPDKMEVSRQLEDVRVQFDLDVVKLVQATTVGESFAYIVNIQGRGKFLDAQKMKGFLKRLARDAGTPSEPQMQPTNSPEPSPELSDQPDRIDSDRTSSPETTPSGTQTPVKTPPTPKESQPEPPKRDRAETEDRQPPQLDVATKIRPISATSVDVVVRADPESSV